MGGQLKPWPAEARTLDEILIGDGYVYRGFVKASPRRHGEFRYAFRPMLAAEVAVVQGRSNEYMEAGQRDKAEALIAKTIADHITWNSVTDGPMKPEEVAQLPNGVYTSVYLQLIGIREMDEGYDEDPEGKPGPTADEQFVADVKN